MADEEIVAGLKKIEDQITRQREDGSKQTGQLTESISKLRSENNQKSDGIVGTLTSSFEDNASEVAAGFILQSKHHSYLEGKGMDKVDDEVRTLTTAVKGGDTEQKSLLQRIAQWVNPNMQGSKDRERDLENTANTNKQTEFFSKMAKSLAGMVVKPIRATAAGIWTFLKGIAFGGALLLLLNFLDSDTWKDWSKWLGEKLIPALKNLGKWFKKLKEDWDDDTIGAMEFMGEHLAGLLTALGVLAVVLSPFKAVGLALGLAWKVGTGWLFVAPIIALFTALGNLPKAAGDAMSRLGAAIAPPVRPVAGGPRTFTGPGGGTFEARAGVGPPTQSGARPTIVTPVGPLGGRGTVTPAVQAKGESRLNPRGGWQKLADKFGFGGKMMDWVGKIGSFAGKGILGWNLYDIWSGDGEKKDKIRDTVGQLAGYRLAIMGATLAAGAAASLPLWGIIAASLAGGAGAWFIGKEAGTFLYDSIFGSGPKAETKSWVNKNIAKEQAASFGGSGAADLLGGAGNDTLGAGTWSAKLMKAGGTPMPRAAPGRANITPVPARPVASAMTDWSATKSAQAYNGGGAGGGSTNVIAPSNTVNNNQSSTTVTSKSISNPSLLLNAVNFAT